ncbi:MAG: sugar-binding domain-containing protein, partial [Pyrinomonadaceae bacterium]
MRQTLRRSGQGVRFMRGLFRLALFVALTSVAHGQSLKLERGWKFLADTSGMLNPQNATRAEGWRDARVGLSWNAQFADLRDYMGVAWYRMEFDAPQLTAGRRAILRFGAVDYFAEVFVNGQRVGEHEGGYTPFQLDVTDKLRPGANELLVRVVDPPMDEKENRARFPETLYKEIPHGKQNWYVQTGGIWQPVWLDVKPREHIKALKITPRSDGNLQVLVVSNAHLGPPPPALAPPARTTASQPRPQP